MVKSEQHTGVKTRGPPKDFFFDALKTINSQKGIKKV